MTVLVQCWRLVLALILWLLIQVRLMIRICRVWLKRLSVHLELEYNGQTITNFSGGFDVYNLDFTTTGYSGYDDNHRPPSELLGTAGNQPQ